MIAVDAVVLKDGDEVLFGVESKCVARVTPRALEDLTVGQLMGSLVEAAANRIEVGAWVGGWLSSSST